MVSTQISDEIVVYHILYPPLGSELERNLIDECKN